MCNKDLLEDRFMDNARLEQVMQNERNRQYWVKPVGEPGTQPRDNETFHEERIIIEFPRRPSGVKIGDILLIHRNGVSQVVYIAECISVPRQTTPDQIEREPWRENYPWYVEVQNLTPEYGSVWNLHDLKTRGLSEEYNSSNPDTIPILNGSYLRGHDKLKVKRPFAEFVMRRIAEL
jgi:hypothetical protein